MRLSKIILFILLSIVLALLVTSCFWDGSIKLGDKDGEIQIGKTKWDKKKMFGLDAPKAKLTSSVSTEEGAMYFFSEMKEKDAEAYIEMLQEKGFTFNKLVFEEYSYTGTNKDGETISFWYDKESGDGTITASKGEKPTGNEDDEVIIGGNRKWDSSKMAGLPDPGTKVVNYWSINKQTAYTLEPLADYLDYVEEIKACGFVVDIQTAEINDIYIFSASNENGDKVEFAASPESLSVVVNLAE